MRGTIPITILMDDHSVQVVYLPKLSEQEFDFFGQSLEKFRPAIIKQSTSSPSDQPLSLGRGSVFAATP